MTRIFFNFPCNLRQFSNIVILNETWPLNLSIFWLITPLMACILLASYFWGLALSINGKWRRKETSEASQNDDSVSPSLSLLWWLSLWLLWSLDKSEWMTTTCAVDSAGLFYTQFSEEGKSHFYWQFCPPAHMTTDIPFFFRLQLVDQ